MVKESDTRFETQIKITLIKSTLEQFFLICSFHILLRPTLSHYLLKKKKNLLPLKSKTGALFV